MFYFLLLVAADVDVDERVILFEVPLIDIEKIMPTCWGCTFTCCLYTLLVAFAVIVVSVVVVDVDVAKVLILCVL